MIFICKQNGKHHGILLRCEELFDIFSRKFESTKPQIDKVLGDWKISTGFSYLRYFILQTDIHNLK